MDYTRRTFCSPCEKDPRKAISYAWFIALFFVLIAFIVACISAASKESNNTLGFAAVWTALLLILLSVGGTLVMKRYQTSLAIGFFLGSILMMSQQCLILFGLFVSRDDSASQTYGSFCFFLFIVYGVFGFLLAIYKNHLIEEKNEVNFEIDDTRESQI